MLRAVVEVDRATMGPERLAAKLTAYARQVHRRLHPEAGRGLCICGAALFLPLEANVPARYCSARCASSAAAQPDPVARRRPGRTCCSHC